MFLNPLLPECAISAKSARKWTTADLDMFNIVPRSLEVDESFGCEVKDLPTPDLTNTPLEGLWEVDLIDGQGPRPTNSHLADFMQMIIAVSSSATEPTVDSLAKTIMLNLGYPALSEGVFAHITIQQQTYLTMGNGRARAHPDLALVDHSRPLLCLFIEDKRLRSDLTGMNPQKWPYAQVVAHVLGAYNVNINEAREQALNAKGPNQKESF